MAAALEVDHEPVIHLGAYVRVAVGEIGERRPDVEPGEEPGGLLDPADGQRHAAPQRVDQLRLARRNPLLRPQHLRLVLLQLRRHVALSAGESLAPLVIRRDSRLVGVRDLDVIAEYLVEPDLERRDTGALALPRLQRGDVPLAAVARVFELVQRPVVAWPDGVAVRELSGRAVHEGAGELVAQVLQELEPIGRLLQQRRPLAPLHAVERGARVGEPPDRVPYGAALPW